MNILGMILCAVIGYLLGNFQTGYFTGKMKGNVDLRRHGSGSNGATNALRVLGRGSGAITLLGDGIKGALAAALGLWIAGWHGGLVAALFVVIGHIWPAFFGFKGGKGVATSIGVLLVLFPWITLLMIAIGGIVMVVGHMVSLGSIVGALVFLVAGLMDSVRVHDGFQAVFVVLLVAIVIFAHRENIMRIAKGTENKLSADMFKRK